MVVGRPYQPLPAARGAENVERPGVELAHDAGLRVNVWTVDDPARMVELADMGVDGIVTNVPDVAANALGRRA